MPVDVDKYLTHTADVYNVIADADRPIYSGGDATQLVSTPVPTPCFAYFGDFDRLGQHLQSTYVIEASPTKWQVLLPKTWANSLKVGAKISNILDEEGNLIREAGYVDSLSVYRHHIYGAQLVIAKLNN